MTRVTVNSLGAFPLTLDAKSVQTVEDAKLEIEAQRGINKYRQRLLFGNHFLDDDGVPLVDLGVNPQLTLVVLPYADTVEQLVDAIESEVPEEVARLLGAPTDPNARPVGEPWAEPPISRAMSTGHAAIVELVLQA